MRLFRNAWKYQRESFPLEERLFQSVDGVGQLAGDMNKEFYSSEPREDTNKQQARVNASRQQEDKQKSIEDNIRRLQKRFNYGENQQYSLTSRIITSAKEYVGSLRDRAEEKRKIRYENNRYEHIERLKKRCNYSHNAHGLYEPTYRVAIKEKFDEYKTRWAGRSEERRVIREQKKRKKHIERLKKRCNYSRR